METVRHPRCMAARRTLPGIMAAAERYWHWLLAGLLLGGLAVRVPFLGGDYGVTNDLATYRDWSRALAARGLPLAYTNTGINYPPMLVYWLSSAGSAEVWLPRGAGWQGGDAALNSLIKLLPALADLATGLLLARAFRSRAPLTGLLAAGSYVLNPAAWYVSAYWGQTDSVYTFLIVLGVAAFAHGALLPAWLALALAVVTKQQAVIVLPIAAAATLSVYGWQGLTAGGSVLFGTAALMFAPWLLTGHLRDAMRGISELAGDPPRIDVSAYNFWYLLRGGAIHNVPASVRLPGLPVSYQIAAIGVCLSASAWLARRAWRDRLSRLAWPAGAACALLYVFMFHARERYLFPLLSLLLLAAAQQPRAGQTAWRLYGLVSLTFAYNLVTIASPNPAWWTNLVANTSTAPLVVVLRALAITAAAWHTALAIALLIGAARLSPRLGAAA